jgi:phosphotransferase system IIB component
METKNKPAFDEVAQGVARIIFGDENITDMNVRLTRIALERYNVPGMQSFDEIAQGVARIIFGDGNVTDMNVRLTRIALERYNVAELLSRSADGNGAPDSVPRLASVSL